MSRTAAHRRMPLALCCAAIVLPLSGCQHDRQAAGARVEAKVGDGVEELGDAELRRLLGDFLARLPPGWHQVGVEAVETTRPFIVDVRPPDEYAQGFIEGAVNVPLRQLVANLETLPDPGTPVLLVGRREHRSAIGMAVLQMLGYAQAETLAGGMEAWRAGNRAIVTGPIPARRSAPAPVDARVRATLDDYLTRTLPDDWGTISAAELTEDQARLSSAELEVQPETFDQGRSLLLDVDEPEEFARANLKKDINVPLRALPDGLDDMPLEQTINWA